MIDTRDLFHKISYLQYPLILIGAYFSLMPYIQGFHTLWENLNNLLIFMGLAVSVSTLQDTTTTQNKLSQRIWEDPLKGKIVLGLIVGLVFFFILTGIFGAFFSTDERLNQLSFGLIVLGIGVIGLLKAAIEMFENHRLDKNTVSERNEKEIEGSATDAIEN